MHENRHAALHLPRVRNRVGKREAVALWRAACFARQNRRGYAALVFPRGAACRTLGTTFDALARQVQARDFADALLLDGFGGAYVEAGCNAAEREIAALLPGKYLTDRFSPGYGDLPLDVQSPLLALTDATRRLGVTLSESNLMNPLKSVTAVIGLSDTPQRARIRGCDFCAMRTRCNLRKAGKTCGT